MIDRASPADDRAALPAAALLAASLLLGGGGSPAPLLEMALQCLVAIIVTWWLLRSPDALRRIARPVWWIAGLVAGLHVVQLVPLPPGMWQALPGRTGEQAALELIGMEGSWRAISLSPPRTLASLLAALSALACMVMVSRLSPVGRWRLLVVTAAAGLATLVIGAAQISGGSGNLVRFFDAESPYLNGFQANHNSTADVILIAMLALAALARHGLDQGLVRPSQVQAAATAIIADAVLVLGLFLTGSRAGLLLLPLVLLLQFLILQPDARLRWGRLAASATLTMGLSALALVLLRGNRTVSAVLARFTLEGEFRPELWRDSVYALGQYWPAGSGQGTFAPVIMAVERLEVVDTTLPHRAHNDYLELAIGAGLPGMIVLTAIAVMLATAAFRALRRPGPGTRPQVLFSLGSLSVIALHSLVDYPMRSMALAAMTATTAGLLFPASQAGSGHSGESQS